MWLRNWPDLCCLIHNHLNFRGPDYETTVAVHRISKSFLQRESETAGLVTVSFDTGPFSSSSYTENGMTVTGDPVFGFFTGLNSAGGPSLDIRFGWHGSVTHTFDVGGAAFDLISFDVESASQGDQWLLTSSLGATQVFTNDPSTFIPPLVGTNGGI